MAWNKKPLKYDKIRSIKLPLFYDNKVTEMAEAKKITVSALLRRIIRTAVHIDLARKKGTKGVEERYRTK